MLARVWRDENRNRKLPGHAHLFFGYIFFGESSISFCMYVTHQTTNSASAESSLDFGSLEFLFAGRERARRLCDGEVETIYGILVFLGLFYRREMRRNSNCVVARVAMSFEDALVRRHGKYLRFQYGEGGEKLLNLFARVSELLIERLKLEFNKVYHIKLK